MPYTFRATYADGSSRDQAHTSRQLAASVMTAWKDAALSDTDTASRVSNSVKGVVALAIINESGTVVDHWERPHLPPQPPTFGFPRSDVRRIMDAREAMGEAGRRERAQGVNGPADQAGCALDEAWEGVRDAFKLRGFELAGDDRSAELEAAIFAALINSNPSLATTLRQWEII